MTERERGRERDLVLAPNEYAYIADETKGNINAYIGPYKSSLANTDQPVVFNLQSKRFERCSLEQAVLTFAVAPVGWYLVLKNPTHDGAHPKTGAINNLVDLQVGRKVNLPGPVSFALWPGQMARVIQGHHLRSNQYLVVRVYDEEAAKANWKNAVIKPQTPGEDAAREPEIPDLPDLTMGKLLVIKGTDVSFYIPPTGVEVVPDAGSDYVREAVTLERLEYCILLDESGNKSYLQGPAVVFPRPTEVFVQRGGARKFRAIELSENSGIYLKVIAPYTEDGREYRVGDELFITGRDRMIYFPRPEHAAIKYGDQAIHYAVAIPAGEARYVLDRNSGQIRLERGPCIFLPDPRREVIVRRVLDRRQVELWFPGNAGALAHNEKLARSGEGGAPALARRREAADEVSPPAAAPTQAVFAGDDFTRSQTFSQPRTIVLDNRYDGAVSISVWTGYAVLAVSKTSERKVIVGPATYLLEYDEVLQAMELSTGTPKTDDDVDRTVYLRVLYNKVSDVVEAETRDLVQVQVRLSYRVNFEGDPQRWFNVENYVKFLTEHLRSLLRGAIKQRAVQEFYPQAVAIVRDVVLGAQGEDGTRTGRRFNENGMRVYDVEVLGVEIGDESIETLLVGAQHAVVEQTLTLDEERRRLELTRERESIEREVQVIQAGTRTQSLALQRTEVGATFELERARIGAEADARKARLDATLADQPAMDTVHAAELARRRSTGQLEAELSNEELALRLRELEAEVHAVAEKARAVSPDLVAALTAFGDRALAEKMAQSMAPLAILGGESVSEVLARLLRGTKLARVLAPALADDAGKPPQGSPDEGQ
jgi:major vault protein